MNLPTTYYDILSEQDPMIEKIVEEDIKILKKAGPFASIDEYSIFFDDYISQLTQSIIQNMSMQVNDFDYDILKDQIESSPEYKQLIHSKSIDYVTLTNFRLFGKKTFYIDSNLAEQMAYTNLEIESEFVQLPFSSCLLIFNDKTTIEALSSLDKGRNVSQAVPISVYCNLLIDNEGNRTLLFACWQSTIEENIVFVKRELFLKNGWKIDDILKTEWTDIVVSNDNNETNDSLFYEEGIVFFRILINTILYLSSSGKIVTNVKSTRSKLEQQLGNIKNKSKRKKANRKINKISALNFIYVGSEYNGNNSKKYDNSLKLNKRFMVRGHWRNQKCGANLTGNKLIWIKPYCKGPEISEIVNKPYKVK